jgi:uncharacterized SAM-binding protein YcdF (DUF218 family)
LLLAVGLVLTTSWWLPVLGWALVRDDGPAKADLAVVLGGDPWGVRISKAGDLARQGFVPAVLVSGPPGYYDEHECDPEIAWAVRHGYSQSYFTPFPHDARSTEQEAGILLPELRRRNVHSILLVTTDYHTRRALRIFHAVQRRLGTAIEMRVIPCDDREFHPGSWWRSRQGQKITFMEWSKTVAVTFGL